MAHHGMNRKDALDEAKDLGAAVVFPRKTGEFRLSHPLMPKTVTGNNREKGVGRHVSSWLMSLAKKKAPKPPSA
jgi:hypothetical protein